MATRAECMRRVATTHGLSGTPTHAAWKRMRVRTSPNAKHKTNAYIGVTCCDRWGQFENFLQDMGPIPPGMSLDRIDNSKGYSPDNCRWATAKEQAVNRKRTVMLEFAGRSMCVNDWAKEIGLSSRGLMKRIKAGWQIERALSPKETSNGSH